MKHLLALLCVLTGFKTQAQRDEISLNAPFVHNNYRLDNSGRGNTWNNGVGVGYKHYFGKSSHFFVTSGVGFYRQHFDAFRDIVPYVGPYPSYEDYLIPVYHYHYDNFQWSLGAGYRQKVLKKYSVNTAVSFNSLETFHQTYYSVFDKIQSSNRYHFGSSVIASAGLSRMLGKHWRVGADALLPFSIRWKKDTKFDTSGGYDKGKFASGFNLAVGYVIR